MTIARQPVHQESTEARAGVCREAPRGNVGICRHAAPIQLVKSLSVRWFGSGTSKDQRDHLAPMRECAKKQQRRESLAALPSRIAQTPGTSTRPLTYRVQFAASSCLMRSWYARLTQSRVVHAFLCAIQTLCASLTAVLSELAASAVL